MEKIKLVYIWSFRNAAADLAGQSIPYQGGYRYMMSPLEYLVRALNETSLGERYELVGVINDDDPDSPRDQGKLAGYGFTPQASGQWFYPCDLALQGRGVNEMLFCVPSRYRRLPLGAAERVPGKKEFEQQVLDLLLALKADVVVLDGLLVILDNLVRPGSQFDRRIFNIHPGITRLDSPYVRRGAYATWDALYGARGLKVVDWQTLETVPARTLDKTGASFHYVDTGIDSGEVMVDALNTPVSASDTILELRWNNFNLSLLPLLVTGLEHIAGRVDNGLDASACTQATQPA
ncbi:N(5)-hydroxyornithine transformylase PvdF [Pseudomonas syringae]|nr:N(5)-hydroxyornithine transformylase PvdF [Pseudomonas syringae]MBD8573707.1 N(5)-hydroxyornithine transformylase PvdF [Pseudomonas syringae]MBD8789831.1 N(5)-hydroxyornithine transformylase PvdF [Pseudomonas syringae]MBD8799806.1 N(5)-hydroxyornithine transformylase PvdF [Pseudomonas syringae]MBD8811198.1 N(5)-hydroxyornithine transformylase PvdF [Pseudomonas syringae]